MTAKAGIFDNSSKSLGVAMLDFDRDEDGMPARERGQRRDGQERDAIRSRTRRDELQRQREQKSDRTGPERREEHDDP